MEYSMKTLQQYGLERGLFGPHTILVWFTYHPTGGVWVYSPEHDMTCLRDDIPEKNFYKLTN